MPKVTRPDIRMSEKYINERADEGRVLAWHLDLWSDHFDFGSGRHGVPRGVAQPVAAVLDRLIAPKRAVCWLSIQRLPAEAHAVLSGGGYGVVITPSERAHDLYDDAGPTLLKAQQQSRKLIVMKEKQPKMPVGHIYQAMIRSLSDLPAIIDGVRLQEEACFAAQEALRLDLAEPAASVAVRSAETYLGLGMPDEELSGLVAALKAQYPGVRPRLGNELLA